ncbi:UNVERIFIED_CONTAM: hypothetical protein Slati_2438000 [Sesamum latifolium]|uniref:Integrase zinc-binding domain-containing protein n=1 Tax=Sesamum latifolium TaxID=2727402 RepID=A0AAW2WE10_9LAMI
MEVFEVEEEDWRQPLVDYLKYGKLPNDPRWRTDTRQRAIRFIYYKGTLYRRSFEGIFLRCLSDEEKVQAMKEAHSGVCGAHQSGPKLYFRIKRMGYYWPTMVKDCMDYARRCQACQFHPNLIHQPHEPLHPTVASWPFDAWGLNVVGPMTKSSEGHMYILAATDYFCKWAEAVPLKQVKKENVANFIRTNIIYRYGVPSKEIPQCVNVVANDLAEAFNKTLCSLLKKVVAKSKRDWHERIGEALWAYRTTVRMPTQSTPCALIYGVEAVLPLEQQIPSLRIAIQEGLTEEENAQIRLKELEALDEKRLEAQQRLECYQARLSSAFNKKGSSDLIPHTKPESEEQSKGIIANFLYATVRAQGYSKVLKVEIESFASKGIIVNFSLRNCSSSRYSKALKVEIKSFASKGIIANFSLPLRNCSSSRIFKGAQGGDRVI